MGFASAAIELNCLEIPKQIGDAIVGHAQQSSQRIPIIAKKIKDRGFDHVGASS
jgi:hypothetical protein